MLAEALDRLNRYQEHIAGRYKALTFADVRLVTIAEGAVNEWHVGLKGTMSAMFLKDFALKAHRGIEGRVFAGQSGGGLSFGNRVPRVLGADGSPIAGGCRSSPRRRPSSVGCSRSTPVGCHRVQSPGNSMPSGCLDLVAVA